MFNILKPELQKDSDVWKGTCLSLVAASRFLPVGSQTGRVQRGKVRKRKKDESGGGGGGGRRGMMVGVHFL